MDYTQKYLKYKSKYIDLQNTILQTHSLQTHSLQTHSLQTNILQTQLGGIGEEEPKGETRLSRSKQFALERSNRAKILLDKNTVDKTVETVETDKTDKTDKTRSQIRAELFAEKQKEVPIELIEVPKELIESGKKDMKDNGRSGLSRKELKEKLYKEKQLQKEELLKQQRSEAVWKEMEIDEFVNKPKQMITPISMESVPDSWEDDL